MVVPDEISRAARDGDTGAIQEWFLTGTRDPDDRDQYGDTLLYYAARNDNCDMMRFLLAHGASINATTALQLIPLHGAVYSNDLDAVLFLIDRGAQIDLPDNDGWTPLIWAAAANRGNCDIIRLLLSRGAVLDACDDDGRTAEAYARGNGRDEAITLLADVRIAGGTWGAYLRVPRKRLLALRVLCEQGRASTDDALLRRLFPLSPPALECTPVGKKLAARDGFARGQVPKEVFWLILEFWRSDRDAQSEARPAA